MNAINTLLAAIGLVATPADAAITIGAVVIGLVSFGLVAAFGTSMLAKKLGSTLIYIGAVFMNLMAWSVPIILFATGALPVGDLSEVLPVLIPGLSTLFLTLIMPRQKVRRAGKLMKMTGQVCLNEKGVFVPLLLAMIFTLVSAVMFAAIVFQLTPMELVIDIASPSPSVSLIVENEWLFLGGLVLYLFVTTFFYNFAYGTSSAMVYIYRRGRDPSLGDGVKSSLGVITGIIALSLMSVIVAIVRMILRIFGREKESAGGAAEGRVASDITGWVWGLINCFTIPAMVAEELGAKDSIKKSVGLVRKNFVDVIIKKTAVRWAFGVLSVTFLLAFAAAGAAIGWWASGGDMVMTLTFVGVFVIFAGIPGTLVLRTFDIVYVTLLYVFIRRKEGEITEKIVIPTSMERELETAYTTAQGSG